MGKHEYKDKHVKVIIGIFALLIIALGVAFASNIFKINKNEESADKYIQNNIENNATQNSTLENTSKEENITQNTNIEEENITQDINIKEDKEQLDSANLSNDLFANYYNQAENILKNMSLEEKVGQMFLVRYPKTGVIEEIKTQYPGGYILFSRDFDNKTKSSMLSELNNCQENSKIKLLLGVDEEGRNSCKS